MPHIFKEMGVLRKAGLLHRNLITLWQITFTVAAVLGSIVLYDILLRDADPLIVLGLVLLGFALGLFLFFRITAVQWDRDNREIHVSKMDVIGVIVLILYIFFDITLRNLLRDLYPASATAYLLSAIFGALLGRGIGTMIQVHRLYLRLRGK